MRRLLLYFICLFHWLPGNLNAQGVVYSENLGIRARSPFGVVGKSGEFYWLVKFQRQRSPQRPGTENPFESLRFDLLDDKLNPLSEFSTDDLPLAKKQWLVCGEKNLDQVWISTEKNNTIIHCNRYGTNLTIRTATVDSLPFAAGASQLLMVRSEDHSKILVLAFDDRDPSFTSLHALLFDNNWNRIYHQVISRTILAQPCIQDDATGFAAESFDNFPIKLANNGEWLMASPSRTNRNLSILHVCPDGREFYFKEISLSPFYQIEDIAMSIDRNNQVISVGLLSSYKSSSLKNVQICNYSIGQGKFEFDSSYHFNTLSKDLQAKNLSRESFIAVPGGGFLLLKEYGIPYELKKPDIPYLNDWETSFLLSDYRQPSTVNQQPAKGYSLNKGLSPIPFIRNKGDLNLFYFPTVSGDSTWSGILETEQHGESNNPDLSYLFIPSATKTYIIYNSTDGYRDPLATTTTLDKGGRQMEESLIFWRMNKMLNFQRSRRITETEIAVPYLEPSVSGFAIIKIQPAG